MSDVRCICYMTKRQITKWVSGSFDKYIGHRTWDIPTFDIRGLP